MTIPEGWKVAVLDPQGTVVDTIDVGGQDLTLWPVQVQVCTEVRHAVRRHEAPAAE